MLSLVARLGQALLVTCPACSARLSQARAAAQGACLMWRAEGYMRSFACWRRRFSPAGVLIPTGIPRGAGSVVEPEIRFDGQLIMVSVAREEYR